MAGFFLVEHGATKQYGEKRRNGALLTGTAVVHSAENFPDTAYPDLGGENVASWITRRTDYGSYHDLADSDSWIPMAPYEYECWHDRFLNNWAYGVAGAFRAHEFHLCSQEYRDRTVENMARAAGKFVRYMREEHSIVVPIALINQSQARARVPGFLAHGTSDPGRRSDPGPYFPWPTFLTATGDYAGSAVIPTPIPPRPPATKGRNFLPLLIDGLDQHRSITERERALAATGDYKGIVEEDHGRQAVNGPMLRTAFQRFLRRKGYYPEPLRIDSVFGSYSVKGEQRWLRSIGTYTKGVDGWRGPETIKGEQRAMNARLMK